MDVYHGTKNVFPEFKQFGIGDAYTIDRALGTHVAKDPAMSSEAFAGVPPEYSLSTSGDKAWAGTPHVIPLKAPPDEAFLRADQPQVRAPMGTEPFWKTVRTDTSAIQDMAALEAYKRDPDLLQAHLERGRNMRPDEARALSRAMVAGESPTIEGKPQDLPYFLRNYGAAPSDAIKQRVVDLARDSWQDKGYAGIKYINTAPMEAGAPGVKDPTSYVVFNPADLRSRFAKFAGDPESMLSPDLMRGAVAAPIGVGAMSSTYDQGTYQEPDPMQGTFQ
jgi:hypothetical protein